MNTSQKNMKDMKDAHGCQYCAKPCFGLQCKDCHMKMVAERSGVCADCSKSFPAKRPDGSLKKRCYECQTKFASENLGTCADCSKSFPAKRPDGSFKKRCYECQTKFASENFRKCNSCDKSTWKQYSFCKDCVPEKVETASVKSNGSFNKCETKTCEKMTTYKYCGDCKRSFNSIANDYMISRCQEDGCSYRGKGCFKFCKEHRK